MNYWENCGELLHFLTDREASWFGMKSTLCICIDVLMTKIYTYLNVSLQDSKQYVHIKSKKDTVNIKIKQFRFANKT